MDVNESLSCLTDTLLTNPMLDFNADTLFSELLCGREDIYLENESICEETSLFCAETLTVEDENHITPNVKVMPKQIEQTRTSKKSRKSKLKSGGGSTEVNVISKKAMKLKASSKSHRVVVEMISELYQILPQTFILHHSFVKLTKIQKLDQIKKFVMNVQQNGYTPNK